MTREIYLDNSATTRPYEEVISYMNDINLNYYGNPSSLHKKGIEAERLIKKSRDIIAKTLSADSSEIIFTSGGTESNNLAIRGFLQANPRAGKHVITTPIEHPSVLEVYKYLSNTGFQVDYLDIDQKGAVDIEGLRNKITEQTSLLSIILVNNETGSIQDIEKIINVKNSVNPKTVLHVDAVQAYGKMLISPAKWGIDIMSMSSHKIHGPKGVGALYVNKSIRIKPILFGGGQESEIRSGTENVAGICGFGMAAELSFNSMEANYIKVKNLRDKFVELLSDSGVEHNIISPEDSLPYILNVSFTHVKSEVLLHHLEEKNIFVSTGSACSSRKAKHSHVLKAMGIKSCDIEGAIRFSFSVHNTEQDIFDTVEALKEIIPRIKIRRGGK
ncbi:MAG TPA: cysteine desulfurase [Clostridiaceae bacterium]|nr:cysteine desulfurase [Clostridiaceae bacterium]